MRARRARGHALLDLHGRLLTKQHVDHCRLTICSVHCAMWLLLSRFWNGSRNAALLGPVPALAAFGKNGVIQICGRFAPTRRTPKSRVLDTVTQYIGSPAEPIVCWNGAQRPHEFVRPSPWFVAASSIAVPVPSAL